MKTNYTSLLSYIFILVSNISYAQQAEGDGTVTIAVVDSMTSQPISGVTVVCNRSAQRHQTDSLGIISFSLAEFPQTILLSHVAYRPKSIHIATASFTQVRMTPNTSQLEEIVINTGYQQVSKERLTGAYTVIDNERINITQHTDIMDRLEGLSNSVMFDHDPNRPGITVRGLSSINGPMQPLVVVDNFPYEGDINNINPNNVESIVILKDAAASSIWGARAGNGVIVITTKKGRFNEGVTISANGSASIQKKPDLFYLNPIATSDFVDTEVFLFSQGRYNALENSASNPALSPVVELLIALRDGKMSESEVTSRLGALRANDVRKDYQDHIYKQSSNQQYAVSLAGGTNDVAYYFSIGYNNNSDALAARLQRLTIDANSLFRLSPSFSLRPKLSFSQINNKSGSPGYQMGIGTFNTYPYSQLFDDSGNKMPWYTYRQPFIDTFYTDKLLDWRYYPADDFLYDRSLGANTTISAGIDMDYRIFKGLSIGLKYNYMKQFVQNLDIHEQESFYARNWINRLTQIDAESGAVDRPVPLGGILLDAKNAITAHNARTQLDFEQRYGQHEVSAIIGAEVAQHLTTSDSHNKYGYDPDVLTYATNVDYANRYPLLIGTSSATILSGLSASEFINRNISAFANAAYTYNSKYVIYASARKDATNYFGVRTNAKGIPLWSAGIAWNINKEPFFKTDAVDDLKLRFTYGFSGNSDNLKSSVARIMHLGFSGLTGLSQAAIFQYPNPELKWERVRTLNLALDFSVLKNRIQGSIDLYNKVGLDLFGSEIADYSNGIGTPTLERNVASMVGRGVDVMLRANIGRNRFHYSPEVNLNWNTDKIMDYFSPLTRVAEYLNNGRSISAMEGKSVYGITNYRWAGLNPQTGEAQGYLDGEVSTNYTAIAQAPSTLNDLAYIGTSRPRIFGNFMQTFKWNGLSLSVNIMFKARYYFVRPTISYSSLVNNNVGHGDFALRWQKQGDELVTSVPVFQYPVTTASVLFYQNSEILATKGDHIRLQFVDLSYDLPVTISSKMRIETARVFLNASNLGVIWKLNNYGIDPDHISSIPSPRQLTVGLNLKF